MVSCAPIFLASPSCSLAFAKRTSCSTVSSTLNMYGDDQTGPTFAAKFVRWVSLSAAFLTEQASSSWVAFHTLHYCTE